MNASHRQPTQQRRRDVAVAAACGVLVAGMGGLPVAAVPLYTGFCRPPGFAAPTRVAAGGPGNMLARRIPVRCDANVSGGLPWQFEPEQNSVVARIGDVVTVNYVVTNI